MPTTPHAEVIVRHEATLTERGQAQLEAFREAFSVGAQLARRRRELDLTQIQVAERSGVSQADVSRIERGAVVPSVGTVQRLASALEAHWILVEGPVDGRPSAETAVA